MRFLNIPLLLVVALISGVSPLALGQEDSPPKPRPLRALLIAGGCCHDYPNQVEIITQGISQRANVEWEVFRGISDRDRKLAIYQTDAWTDGYDVVVHNECYGAVDDVDLVQRLVQGHSERGVPAVAIHCSMHSYRAAKTDLWREFLGVTSVRHERGGVQLDVVNRAEDHPIMKGFPAQWRTPNGELYVIEKTWPNCRPLATAYGVGTEQDQTVLWTNEYGRARIFGTTLGHHNETMLSDEWLDVVARGLLWSCGKLDDSGRPLAGYEGTGKSKIRLAIEPVKPTPGRTPTLAVPEAAGKVGGGE